MISSIGSSIVKARGGNYLQKEAEKANAQFEAAKPSIIQSEQKNVTDELRKKFMPQDLTPDQAKAYRGELRKQVRGLDSKVWDSYVNEYMRATSKKSVVDRIALLEKARGQKFEMPEIGGKK